MKAVILAGGLGTRLSEETVLVPKPMIEIGSRPILWHIMKIYYSQGIKDFLILAGYKAEAILDFFANYSLTSSDVATFEFEEGVQASHYFSANKSEDWRVTVLNTGIDTQTGGRLLRAKRILENEKSFFFTYGDGLTTSDLKSVEDLRRVYEVTAALTAVIPPTRYGALKFSNHIDRKVSEFVEKPVAGEGYINGGYMSLTPRIFDYLKSDATNFEAEVLPLLADEGQLVAHKHDGFWMSMDTLRDKVSLAQLVSSGEAPWISW